MTLMAIVRCVSIARAAKERAERALAKVGRCRLTLANPS
jgi:hypothetical protein